MTMFHRTVCVAIMMAATTMLLDFAAQAAPAQLPAPARPTKPRTVLYEPSGYERVGLILNRNREFKYYLFNTGTELKLELEGTTALDVKVRLLHDMTMKGAQPFTVLIEEIGFLGKRAKVASYSLTANKSPVSTLKGQAELVPSKASSFTLAVPDGRHRYAIRITSTTAKQAAIRILIPRRDLQPAKKGTQP